MNFQYVFDIETLADPEAEIDEDDLKTGNLKDPAKIEARKTEARAKALERAALSPLTGKVAAIGILGPTRDDLHLMFGHEEELIRKFFDYFYIESGNVPWIGHNITDFDLPFLIRRAWRHSIEIPAMFYGRYLPGNFVDLARVWRLYGWEPAPIGLSRLADFLGLGQKLAKGSAFASLLYESEERAREYLKRDLELTWDAAVRMGVIHGEQPKPKSADESVQTDSIEEESGLW